MKINQFLFCYSPVSVIEIKWQIINLGRSGHNIEKLEQQFSQALTSLKEDNRFEAIDFLNAQINDISFELRKLGHNDYFDTVIASSALWETSVLVTEDKDLKNTVHTYIISNKDLNIEKIEIYNWKDFYQRYKED